MRIVAQCLVALAVLIGVAAAQVKPKADVVIVNSRGEQKEEKNVDVIEYSWSALEVKLRTGARRFDANDVVSVEYTKAPTGYPDARAAFGNGDFRTAIEGFQNLAEADLKDSESWAKEDAHYYLWASYRRVGAFEDAEKAAADLRTVNAKSHWLPEIVLQETEDNYGLGDFAKAEKAFGAVADQAKTQNWSSRFKVIAELGRVRALIAMKKNAEADAILSQVSGAIAVPELADRAKVVKGEIMLAAGRVDEAQKHFQKLLDDTKDWQAKPFVFAGAANGLGDCYYEKGDYLHAAEEFSKTFALFSEDGRLENEIGWAIWRFANANNQLSAKTEDKELAREYKGRYLRMRQAVAQDYRMTRGGQLARKELGVGK
ncbi:MAG: tetratricopeptide repeat protein [Planctomycetes bacterium]|nr:tetratricopeptide repeat protein [Planctomycetota bacterium]